MKDKLVGIGKKINGRGCFVRDDYILRHCKSKRVLHVGCTDYPFFETALSEGHLLHEKITQVADKVIGIDVASADVSKMAAHGYDVKLADAQKITNYDWDEPFDIILLADVIEHIPNTGLVIEGASKLLSKTGKIVITVPNAFGIVRFLKSFFRYEQVHQDHVAYYSSGVLETIAERLSLVMQETAWYRFEVRDKRIIVYLSAAIERLFTVFFPWYAEGCMAVMTVQPSENNV
ncbi:MAG: methyltransferase domain-containing protein [Cyanobacteria bacterium P01_D01_bin.105]